MTNVVLFYLQGSELIVNYDEHVLTNTFKFGVIYQRYGQVRLLYLDLGSDIKSSGKFAIFRRLKIEGGG